ncbi:hypothetical protein V7166_19085 [Bacillus thuringiensis]
MPLVEPKAYENVKQIVIVGIPAFIGLSVYGIVVHCQLPMPRAIKELGIAVLKQV